MYIILFC